MDRWGIFIAIFVAAWVLQIILTYKQNQYFRKTIRDLTHQYDSGYLGVGVVKKRFGIGSIVILVADLTGKVVHGQELTGVTVFARFQPLSEIIGQPLEQIFTRKEQGSRMEAMKLAAERIVEQQTKAAKNESDLFT